MTNKAYQIEYRKTKDEQANNPRENSETSEPIWKIDRDWKEFYLVRFE